MESSFELHRVRSRPTITLRRVHGGNVSSSELLANEIFVSVQERGASEVFFHGERHDITPGHVCALEARELVHLESHADELQYTSITIPEAEVRILSSDPDRPDVMPKFAHCTYDAALVGERLLAVAESVVNDAPVLEQDACLASFYDELVTACSTDAPPPPSGRAPSRSVRVARDFLDATPERDVRLVEIAAAAGITACHLAHVFTRAVGVSVHAYHLLVRIRRARELLGDGLSAGEAGAAVGFADQSHFTRHFKRIVGVPPGSYARGLRRSIARPTGASERSERESVIKKS